MHETLIDDVKLHVDEVSSDEDNALVKGWCASDSTKVEKIPKKTHHIKQKQLQISPCNTQTKDQQHPPDISR